MKKFISNLFTITLLIFSIVIFCVTLYFCLDVFEIVQIPEKYSLVSMFYSKIEVIASNSNIMENVNPEEKTIEKRPRKTISAEKETYANSAESTEFWAQLEEQQKYQENVEMDEGTTPQNFYYEQLDEYAKIIYDKLNSNLESLKTGMYTADFGLTFDELLHQEGGDVILKDSFQLAINALTFDNPDLFYLDVTKLYLLTEVTTRAFSKKYEVTIGPNEESYLSKAFPTEQVVTSAINMIEQEKNNLINQCQNKNTVEKIKIVHDYLVDNTEYDLEAGENIYNVYGTLIDKKSVCEGYARSFKYIMDDLNIPCIIACGIGKNSEGKAESHAWNYVQIDEQWYAIDVTWDDPVITGPGYLSEAKKQESKYEYYLNGSNKFFEDHFEDGNIVGEANFKYPTLSVLNYK